MIFVTLGSQKFQFNRLLEAIDQFIAEGKITETVFAQTGYSDYIPQNYKYQKFLNRDEFSEMQSKADLVITHGGTGAIVGALKKEKKVIAVPRLSKFGEHVDDHQCQIIDQFKNLNLICACDKCSSLPEAIDYAKKNTFNLYKSNTNVIIESIELFINE